MSRTTLAQLKAAVDHLNTVTGNPVKPYEKDADGKYRAQEGNYHIDQCYGGFQLAQIVNESGGIRMIQPCRGTKTECYNTIHSILNVHYNSAK